MKGKVRLASAIGQFLDAVKSTVSPATWALYDHYLSSFLDASGNVELMALTPAKVKAWNAKYHPCGCVRRLMRWAVTEGRLIPFNPLDGMRSTRNGHRQRILSRCEFLRIFRNADKVFRRFLLAMSETIARPREIRAVRWGDIRRSGSPAWTVDDLRGGRCFFRLVRFKGQEARRDRLAVRNIPISRRLGRLLARIQKDGQDLKEVVFRNRSSREWTHNAVRLRFQRLRVKAGLVADVDGENVVAYTLRHTSATDAVGAGLDGLLLAELMGHSDVRMTQRYTHLRPDHLIKAMGRLEEWKRHSAG